MANFHSINGNEVEAHYAGGDLREEIDNKADSDGYHVMLTAGAADNLTARGDGVTASFLYRTTGGSASVPDDAEATVRSIKGRTLAWNQLVQPVEVTNTVHGITFVRNLDGTLTANGTADSNSYALISQTYNFVGGHKYAIKGCPSGGSASGYRAYVIAGSNHYDYGSGDLFTVASSFVGTYVEAFIPAGTTVTDLVFRPQLFDLTQMFGAGNEPSTVAEFEALYPLPYYAYDAGSLLPVKMLGIETIGFNQWDGTYSETNKYIHANGGLSGADADFDVSDYIPVIGGQTYYVKGLTGSSPGLCWYDADKQYISGLRNYDLVSVDPANTFTVPSNAAYVRSTVPKANAASFCINLSWSGRRNGEYEAFWKSQRLIDVANYFPDGMRSAGSVYDELTSTEAITRVGMVDLGTLTWTASATNSTGQYRMVSQGLKALIQRPASSAVLANLTCQKYDSLTSGQVYQLNTGISAAADGDLVVYDPNYAASNSAAAFKDAMSGVMLHYALATPTVTPIDQPLNMTYRTEQGGTERVMVPTGENSAPPTLVTAQGYTAESLRDAALSAIAPVENGLASTNYGVGSYLVHAGQLCKVTTAIATGEAITIGTNVTATTVMAEVIALIAQ